ncbi:MAG: hypothetical protein NXI19_02910 [Alphaproteobacteria bacterium]|nr:hypothetical protein [Alphaproteobacteria bacterium]
MGQSTRTAKFGVRGRDLLIAVIALGMIAAVAVSMLGRSSEIDLRRSAIGFEGLSIWLTANEIDVRITTDQRPATVGAVGLRILPLFDGDPVLRRADPDTGPDRPMQQDQMDLDWQILERKIQALPTLVILPKWRSGMAALGEAKPAFLRAWKNQETPVQLGRDRIRQLVPEDGGFADDPVTIAGAAGLETRLYLPQVIAGSDCTPILGSSSAMVLGQCARNGVPFFLLSDPDLLNNHGLGLGDNAAIARMLIPMLAARIPGGTFAHADGTGVILIDLETETSLPLVRRAPDAVPGEAGVPEGPSLSELLAYPMSLVWASLAVLGVLVVWRGSVRVRPVLADPDTGPAASKAASIEAQARLLRLSGHDSDLLFAHVDARLKAVAAEILGPQRRDRSARGDPLRSLAAVVARKDADLGARLTAAATTARRLPDRAAVGQVVDCLDQFEIAIEQVLHDFGRTVQPR